MHTAAHNCIAIKRFHTLRFPATNRSHSKTLYSHFERSIRCTFRHSHETCTAQSFRRTNLIIIIFHVRLQHCATQHISPAATSIRQHAQQTNCDRNRRLRVQNACVNACTETHSQTAQHNDCVSRLPSLFNASYIYEPGKPPENNISPRRKVREI